MDRELGHAPKIVSQLAIYLKSNPNLERALEFISKYSEGKLAKDFRNLNRDILSGKVKNPIDGLLDLSKSYSDFSGLSRSLSMIASSFFEKDKTRRSDVIDRSINVLLSDTLSRTRDYINSIQIPTLIIFSFGIIMPLMLISLLPVLSLFSMNVSIGFLSAFLAVSVAAVYLYSDSILKKRPISFSDQNIIITKPNKFFFVSLAILISVPGILYLIENFGVKLTVRIPQSIASFSIIWGIGLSAALYYYLIAKAGSYLRKKIKRMDSQLIDFIHCASDKLSEGRPIEEAISFSLKMSNQNDISIIFSSVLNLVKKRGLSINQAFKEVRVESKTVRSFMDLLLDAMRRGSEAASEMCRVMISYTEEMRKVEKEMLSMLEKNLSMMRMTTIFFAPFVCSIIVVLFEMLSQNISKLQDSPFIISIDSNLLTLLVGIYCIALNFVLIRFASNIAYGKDEIGFSSEISQSLPLVLCIFTLSTIALRLFLLK